MATSNCTTKLCSKCNKRPRYRSSSWCLECHREDNRQRKKNGRKQPIRRRDGLRQCSHCLKWHPETDEYFRKRGDSDNYRSWCRGCLQENGRDYQHVRRQDDGVRLHERQYDRQRRLDPEVRERERQHRIDYVKRPEVARRLREYAQAYEQRPERRLSRRARMVTIRAKRKSAPGSYTREDIELLLRTQKGKCWWCGKPHGDNYEIDHRIPLSRGGTNWPDNLCISCFECNRSKHNKLPHEWNGRLL